MNKTAIEWCDQTWNPVTGCKHDCPYCYARNITNRFKGEGDLRENKSWVAMMESHYEQKKGSGIYYIRQPLCRGDIPKLYAKNPAKISSYPFGFAPTFHRYRLDEPQRYKKPQTVFVGSMCDLFGSWVPDEWIQQVIGACQKYPQHRYIFLTKNYRRYNELREREILPLDTNMYFGVSVTTERQLKQACLFHNNIDFLSIEPLMEYIGVEEWFIDGNLKSIWKWVIVGAETGNRKGKVIPEFDWIDDIVYYSKKWKIPLFMKDSLKSIWEKQLIQEYPWEVKA